MLTAIRVGNFKAFAESQRVTLRPLTLIFGANSSGKSSLLHSLLLARDAEETGNLDVHRTHVGGDSVDLGGFRQFVHRRDVNRTMEWSAELDTAKFTGRLAQLFAPVKHVTATMEIGLPQIEVMKEEESVNPRTGETIRIKLPTGQLISTGDPKLMSFALMGDGKPLMQMSRRHDGKLQLDRLDHEHPIFREVLRAIVETSTTTPNIQPSDYEGLSEAISEIVPEIAVVLGKFLPEGLVRSDVSVSNPQITLFPVSRGRRKEDLAAAVQFFMPRTLDEIIGGVRRAISDELARLRYLGPLRSYPPRHLAFSQYHDPNWYAGGGYAWDIVRKNTEVRNKVNAWLGAPDRLQTPYQLQIRHLLTIDDLQSQFSDVVSDIEEKFLSSGKYEGVEFKGDLFGEEIPSALDRLKENELKLSDVHDLVLIDGRSNTIVSHRDVGIGVSQVLPVLVAAFASHDQIIAIEQPEIHLHPGLQADLGDLFINSALGEQPNTFLLETHSEHLILRILRRIRETTEGELPSGLRPIKPEDVAVLYVSPSKDGCKVIDIPINPDGEFAEPWPDGFFPERAKELF
jgi:AAA15 family ATPase/GTPase